MRETQTDSRRVREWAGQSECDWGRQCDRLINKHATGLAGGNVSLHSLINDVATIINYTYACRTHSPEKWMKGSPQLGQQSHSEACVVCTTAISFNLQSILQASFPSLLLFDALEWAAHKNHIMVPQRFHLMVNVLAVWVPLYVWGVHFKSKRIRLKSQLST